MGAGGDPVSDAGAPWVAAAADVEVALRSRDPRARLESTLRRFEAGRIEVPSRLDAGHSADGSVTHVMLARDDERRLVLTKVVDYDPARPRRAGRAASAGLMTLLRDGVPLLTCSADRFTGIRTGLVAAFAIERLAPPGALDVALVGPGLVGTETLHWLARFRPVERVHLVGRDPARTDVVARRLATTLEVPVEAVADVRSATEGSSVLITATSTVEPIIDASDLDPDLAMIAALGAGIAERRELSSDVVAGCQHIVVDSMRGAEEEAGDLLLAADDGVIVDHEPLGRALTTRPRPGRILYESVGSAWQDLACALSVLDQLRPGWDTASRQGSQR